ncbi:transglycosylase SLT domain-containing protein [Escherichia coli]|nr:o94 [Escherichia coli E22]
MIDYKKNLLFILVFISGFILFTVYSYTAEKMIYNETCTANWVIFNDQGRANLTIDFMFNKKNKTGTVALSGTWQQGNRESKSIRRNIEYTWIENYDTAHLTSKKVNKFEIMDQVDDDRLVQLIPDFYVFPEKSVSYNILKLDNPCLNIKIGTEILYNHFSRCGVTWQCLGTYNAGFAMDNQKKRQQYAPKYILYIPGLMN